MASPSVVWLHTNRRALRLGLLVIVPMLILAVFGVFAFPVAWLRWVSAAVSTGLFYAACLCGYLMTQPRLSYSDGHLLVQLRPGKPLRVPIDVVECFFLGQGPALLPHPFGDGDKLEETSNIIVRLAESAEEWKHHDVKATLGLWCDGYITIRGTWCEPINADLVKRLNEYLIAAHRELKSGDAERNSSSIEQEDNAASSTSEQEQQVG